MHTELWIGLQIAVVTLGSNSLMDVVLTFECVRVLLFVVDSLYLYCRVVQIVLSSQKVSHLGQSLQRLDRLDVAGH